MTIEQAVLTALLSEEGYKGYRLYGSPGNWQPQYYTEAFGGRWEHCKRNGSIRVYKRQSRAVTFILVQLAWREAD